MTINFDTESFFSRKRISWLELLLFAFVCGIYTGAVMLIPGLEGTSFQDIGIFPDRWLVFAVIIAVCSGSSLEAGIKCFVFFLISQPLVYATEILFGSLSVEMAWLYYRQMWLPVTFLTFPGGCVAYFVSRETPFGAFILGLGNSIQGLLGFTYAINMTTNFPKHLYSVIFCLSSIAIMSFALQHSRGRRTVALALPVVVVLVIIFYTRCHGLYFVSGVF